MTYPQRATWILLRLLGFQSASWNSQYAAGRWSNKQASPITLEFIARLCRGKIVEFGCGEGELPAALPPDSFTAYEGFDIAPIAIERARSRKLSSCIFMSGNMADWRGNSGVSLIVAEECLYYLSAAQQKRWLETCRRSLLPDGHILVVVHDAAKHASTLDVCREIRVIEERTEGTRCYLVLR